MSDNGDIYNLNISNSILNIADDNYCYDSKYLKKILEDCDLTEDQIITFANNKEIM
jgi:hypothetical protein